MWFVITDTHLGHNNIIKYCNRPDDFSERIVNNWKATVKADDYVIHLGDVAWPTYYDVLKELPGHKILVKGNHDKKSDTWYLNHGFDFVVNEFANRIEGIDMLFSHEPRLFHNHDINVCGHLHNGASVKSGCPIYVMALEYTGYRVMPMSELVSRCTKVIKEYEDNDD